MLAKKLAEFQEEHRRGLDEESMDQDDAGIRQEELMRWYMDTQQKR